MTHLNSVILLVCSHDRSANSGYIFTCLLLFYSVSIHFLHVQVHVGEFISSHVNLQVHAIDYSCGQCFLEFLC